MLRESLETTVSGVLVFASGYLLWPPISEHFYWGVVSDRVGGFLIFPLVIVLCFCFGFVVRRSTPIKPVNFAIGGLLAYLFGMYLIDTTMKPGSPVHWLGYGLLLAGMILGHAPREILDAAMDGFVSMLGLSASK